MPEQKHVHRLDFTVTGAGTPSTTTYSMTLAERSTGEIHQGMNVPLAPPGGARVDVGLKIRAFYSMVGDDLLVGCDASVSSEEASGTIRKVTSTGDALVTPGKPTLVASADDPQAKKRYEITVVATRLK